MFSRNIPLFFRKKPSDSVPLTSPVNIKEPLFLVMLFIVAALLFLTNLGNIYLWQDEAQTALIAQTILESGFPRGYDGVNFFSQELGAEYGEGYLWKWHPWFPFYLLALFFKVFGVSTFVARLPFALFGIANLFLLYFFCKYLFKNRTVAVISTGILLFSVPFILLSRQCRYYSVAAFLSMAGLYSYRAMMEERRFSSLSFFLASTFLFHTHYIYLGTLFASVFLHSILFHRKKWKELLLWEGVVLLFNSPWIVWFSTMNYSDQYKTKFLDLEQFFSWFLLYIEPVGRYVFPVPLLLAALCLLIYNLIKRNEGALLNHRGTRDAVSLPFIFITVTITAISLVGSAPFFRFLTPAIPLFALLTGVLLGRVLQINFFIGVVSISAVILHGPLKDLLYELTHDYDGPIEGIVKYLQKSADSKDVVAITYGDFPLKFYTGLRVVGGLTGESLADAKDADWVIVRKNVICEKDFAVRKFLLKNVKWKLYSRIELDYPDLPFENRESPAEHLYRTKQGYPGVLLFERSNKRGSELSGPRKNG